MENEISSLKKPIESVNPQESVTSPVSGKENLRDTVPLNNEVTPQETPDKPKNIEKKEAATLDLLPYFENAQSIEEVYEILNSKEFLSNAWGQSLSGTLKYMIERLRATDFKVAPTLSKLNIFNKVAVLLKDEILKKQEIKKGVGEYLNYLNTRDEVMREIIKTSNSYLSGQMDKTVYQYRIMSYKDTLDIAQRNIASFEQNPSNKVAIKIARGKLPQFTNLEVLLEKSSEITDEIGRSHKEVSLESETNSVPLEQKMQFAQGYLRNLMSKSSYERKLSELVLGNPGFENSPQYKEYSAGYNAAVESLQRFEKEPANIQKMIEVIKSNYYGRDSVNEEEILNDIRGVFEKGAKPKYL